MEIVKTVDLCKFYGTGDARVDALAGVNLSVEAGEFVAVIGPSGSGKSTLLHLLGGVDRPTSGKVLVAGEDVYAMKERDLAVFRRRRIGFVFQFYNLIPVLTAEENMLMPLLLDHQPVDKAYFEDMIGLLGLKERRNHLPSQLSGGQQQRVSIGRALANKPSILLADEPTGNLDRRNSREIMDLLRLSVRKYKQTLMIITHDPEIAAQADRVVTIEDGRLSRLEVASA